ncbi:MAG TPA: DUF4744 domain-containing protein [Herpetosiphonaceae bacterium]
MNSKLLAFNIAQDLPDAEIDAADAHYDAQEQVWVDNGQALAATNTDHKAYACSSGYKLKNIGNGYTTNTDGYGTMTDGYGMNTDGYGTMTDGYGTMTDGYGTMTDGYGQDGLG